MSAGRILIAEDQADVRLAARVVLESAGFVVDEAETAAAVLSAVQRSPVDAILLDLNFSRDTTSGEEGLSLIRQLREQRVAAPIVVITAWGNVPLAVRAMQAGAQDFLEKPWDNRQLLQTLAQHLHPPTRRVSRPAPATETPAIAAEGEVLAQSGLMRELLRLATRIARSDVRVLLSGENGTGKSLLAQHLHAHSPRAAAPFVAVNLGAVPDNLFESELFGHKRGAFTDAREDRIGRFELADGGTLFLDEIGTLPLHLQPKLLRVLETGEFERVGESRSRRCNVRVISASNADLPALITEGRFREDLYFRLNAVELRVPALRERPEDILPLAEAFLARINARQGSQKTLSDAAREALLGWRFPGNVRELRHVMERAALLAEQSNISVADLALRATDALPGAAGFNLAEVEKATVERALRVADGKVDVAAKLLGLSRSALYRRLGRKEDSKEDNRTEDSDEA